MAEKDRREWMFEFAGVTAFVDNTKEMAVDTAELWTELLNDAGNAYWMSNVHTHSEEGLEFEYRYVVNATITGTEARDSLLVSLDMIILPQYLSKAKYNDMVGCYEWTDETSVETTVLDLTMEGYVINMGYKSYPIREEEGDVLGSLDRDWDAGINQIILGVMATSRTIDGLRGFFLDRIVTGNGKNGWDYIQYFTKDVPIWPTR